MVRRAGAEAVAPLNRMAEFRLAMAAQDRERQLQEQAATNELRRRNQFALERYKKQQQIQQEAQEAAKLQAAREQYSQDVATLEAYTGKPAPENLRLGFTPENAAQVGVLMNRARREDDARLQSEFNAAAEENRLAARAESAANLEASELGIYTDEFAALPISEKRRLVAEAKTGQTAEVMALLDQLANESEARAVTDSRVDPTPILGSQIQAENSPSGGTWWWPFHNASRPFKEDDIATIQDVASIVYAQNPNSATFENDVIAALSAQGKLSGRQERHLRDIVLPQFRKELEERQNVANTRALPALRRAQELRNQQLRLGRENPDALRQFYSRTSDETATVGGGDLDSALQGFTP